jgi:glutaredoxin-dependent peroxiredoxin
MALSIGSKAPAFTLFDTERKPRSLSEFLGKKTVLAFYPGAFTGVCTKEMCALRDSMASLAKVEGQVVGISGDSPFANKAFADQNKLSFPLLSDFDLLVSKQYVGVYESFARIAGYKASKRSILVLDSTGTVKYVWVTEDPGVEPPYEEINKALASF